MENDVNDVEKTDAEDKGSDTEGKAVDSKAADTTKAETTDKVADKVEDKASVKADDKASEQVSEVPEKYELSIPEKSLLDKTDVDRITATAKELGLSNDEAQDLLEIESQAMSRYHDRQMAEITAMKDGWLKESEGDKEIGGKMFNKNIELAKRVVDRFGSPAFKQALIDTGFGNHPEVIRTFMRIGLLMSEDQFVHAKDQGAAKKDMATVFYGETT